ncbi:Uncharacterized membrane protein [Tistlia consotensis]|uniref:Uncharacterized membrane protein n=1 Tax=Tistlia consotensis USBA 355 TaxID=560819 RepID=A0A1Y6BMK9_9PROT|nr:DUF2244 domain-containing protein [Tistlia consotensis]SMF08512.1 Uncharacterized membrane protein [Tistlia consotensis USBA 355]SNR35351.1 Uncharacterized membrane protein [Tistlia consotensis]
MIESASHAATEQELDEEAARPVVFEALLTPYRSLSPRGFLILMSAVACVAFAAGMTFFQLGAWPVPGFMGAEVLLIYGAFKINYRRAKGFERLELTADRLTVRRVDHWGEETTWRFQPYWLRIEIADPPEPDSPLSLRSHGRSLTIGGFLSAQERLELAKTLRAELAKLRQPAPPAPAA